MLLKYLNKDLNENKIVFVLYILNINTSEVNFGLTFAFVVQSHSYMLKLFSLKFEAYLP